MFCKSCGAEMNNWAVICPSCGIAVSKSSPPRVMASSPSLKKVVLIVVSIIAVPFLLISFIASKSFMDYRQAQRYHTCISNQATILTAAENWLSKGRHIAPRLSDLTDYFRNDKVCPSGGTYSIFFAENGDLTVSCSKHVYKDE